MISPSRRRWEPFGRPSAIKSSSNTWFGRDAQTLAEEIDFIFRDHATEEPGHVLKFGEWEGTEHRLELEAVGGATRFRVVLTGGAADWDEVYEDITQGWITFVQQLRLALEQHAGDGRRTIFLSVAAQAGVGDPSTALGLDRRLTQGAGSARFWFWTGGGAPVQNRARPRPLQKSHTAEHFLWEDTD